MIILKEAGDISTGLFCSKQLKDMAFHYVKSNFLFAESQFEQLFMNCSRPFLIADQLRNPTNAGALIRLGDNIGVNEVFFLGDENSFRRDKMRQAAASSYNNIPWSFIGDDALFEKISEEYTIVAIETAKEAKNVFTFEMPEKAAFIVGNERAGIRENILEKVDRCVYIPVPGPTRSLNVSHAASVVLFEWLRQMMLRCGMI
ncbi:MAG: TrmH family RNA methyltransferase [Bacteroidetes bacterium HGW-Bacteroidetes-1]|nr:MAG: TrmH family RNA methyltransferase [Bacteroidetes bacterium HGW-Bacteroidetes-1]